MSQSLFYIIRKYVHPKVVSERLGHSKVATTMDIYSHVIPTIQEQAIEVFDEEVDEEEI